MAHGRLSVDSQYLMSHFSLLKSTKKVNHDIMFNLSFEEVSCYFGKLSLFLQNNIKKV